MAALALYPPTGFDATLYHLPFARAFAASGRLPFQGASDASIASAILRDEPPRLPSIKADLAPELEHPVLYQTIRELLEALADEHEVRPSDLPARWFE